MQEDLILLTLVTSTIPFNTNEEDSENPYWPSVIECKCARSIYQYIYTIIPFIPNEEL